LALKAFFSAVPNYTGAAFLLEKLEASSLAFGSNKSAVIFLLLRLKDRIMVVFLNRMGDRLMAYYFSLSLVTCLVYLTSPLYADNPTVKESLLTATYLGDEEAVQVHLKDREKMKGELNPECPANTRCKPVTYAAEKGHVGIMKLLLDAGADIEGATGGSGDTPLILAMLNNHQEMVKFLVERGADVNGKNNFGATPFWAACWMGDTTLVDLFIANDADLEHSGQNPDPLKESTEIVTGITPLMIAAFGGHKAVVTRLLDAGAIREARDSLNRTAYDYAVLSDVRTLLRVGVESHNIFGAM